MYYRRFLRVRLALGSILGGSLTGWDTSSFCAHHMARQVPPTRGIVRDQCSRGCVMGRRSSEHCGAPSSPRMFPVGGHAGQLVPRRVCGPEIPCWHWLGSRTAGYMVRRLVEDRSSKGRLRCVAKIGVPGKSLGKIDPSNCGGRLVPKLPPLLPRFLSSSQSCSSRVDFGTSSIYMLAMLRNMSSVPWAYINSGQLDVHTLCESPLCLCGWLWVLIEFPLENLDLVFS